MTGEGKGVQLPILKEFVVYFRLKVRSKLVVMDESQLVCYSKGGTCSLRNSVCCVLITFLPF